MEYIKGVFNCPAVDLQYTTKIDNSLYKLSPDDLERFRLHGPPPPKERVLRAMGWWYLSPAAYDQKKQADKAKKQLESLKAASLKPQKGLGGKRKKSKKRKSKRKKSKRKKTKRKNKYYNYL